MKTGTAKLREQINTHLETLRNGPHIRRRQILLCYQITHLQDEIDSRRSLAKAQAMLREAERIMAEDEAKAAAAPAAPRR